MTFRPVRRAAMPNASGALQRSSRSVTSVAVSTRPEAARPIALGYTSFIRRATLEDVFLHLTGRRLIE